MKIGVIVFPGSNCDRDMYHVLTDVFKLDADYFWHEKGLPKNIDAVILPGGYGAACNLSTFAQDGVNALVMPEIESFLLECQRLKKPIGAICIAPNIVAKLFGKENVEVTIGNDQNTASNLQKMGAKHINKKVNEIVIDSKNLVVSTPAYMLAKGPAEVEAGINNLVEALIELIKKSKSQTPVSSALK